jgi:hypothetical protein
MSRTITERQGSERRARAVAAVAGNIRGSGGKKIGVKRAGARNCAPVLFYEIRKSQSPPRQLMVRRLGERRDGMGKLGKMLGCE